VTSLPFSVCLVNFADFKKHGKLLMHEEARQRGDLVVLDVYEHVLAFSKKFPTMFVSHQWLGLSSPDPNNVHFNAIIAAVDMITAKDGLDPKNFYLWVDYVCIPQRNPTLMQLSIASLGVYSSFATYFVIVAPATTHFDRGTPCNMSTYEKRGWTRVEQWARMTFVGFENMFIFAGTKLEPVEENQKWYESSIRVVEGEYTVEADKKNQVDPVIGLWCYAIKNKGDGKTGKTRKIFDAVMRAKQHVFPKALFEDLVDMLDEPEVRRAALSMINESPKQLPALPPDVMLAAKGQKGAWG